MTRNPEQTFIPGTEPPPEPERDVAIDEILHGWLDAKAAQKKAADDTRLRHLVLVATLAERGIDRYPYVDAFTGKKRFVAVKRDPKAVTTKAPKPPKPRKEREPKADPADQVEHRKVSRESVAAEIDPFGTTRSNMGKVH